MNVVIHGWYRYTDILWEWQKVLPQEFHSPIKSFIHADTISSPEHPLHDPVIGGVELYIGTLPDHESRLLFSSKQIEYLRYWVKAVGLVDQLIPLPHSECLLTKDVLQSVAPVIIRTGAEMKAQQKQIEKLNKRLRGNIDANLAAMRQVFERVRASYNLRAGTWIVIDFEAWELDHSVVTEFGYAKLEWRNDQPVITPGHLIIKENRTFRNGTFVPDAQDKFSFGTSETLPLAQVVERIKELVKPESPKGPVFLVFHDHTQDIATLVNPKYKLNIFETKPTVTLPDTPPEGGTFVVDTSYLFAAMEGDSESRRKLEDVYRKLTHSVQYDFHNAGNDARYTLTCLQEMAEGGPLDSQRERRWPAPILEPGAPPMKKTLRVNDWKPEDDSDYEDQETFLRPDEGFIKLNSIIDANKVDSGVKESD